jgi:hypothetical protein
MKVLRRREAEVVGGKKPRQPKKSKDKQKNTMGGRRSRERQKEHCARE